MPPFDRYAAERFFHERWVRSVWEDEYKPRIDGFLDRDATQMADGYLELQRRGRAELAELAAGVLGPRRRVRGAAAVKRDAVMDQVHASCSHLLEHEEMRRSMGVEIVKAVEANLGVRCMDMLSRSSRPDATCTELVKCYVAAISGARAVFDPAYRFPGYGVLQERCGYLTIDGAIAEADRYFEETYCDARDSLDEQMVLPLLGVAERLGLPKKQAVLDVRLMYNVQRLLLSQRMAVGLLKVVENVSASSRAARDADSSAASCA
jgi:hypothetical protein